MFTHRWCIIFSFILSYVTLYILYGFTSTWALPTLHSSCKSCHLDLVKHVVHPFPTPLPPHQRRNPRCMRCHQPFRFNSLSSIKEILSPSLPKRSKEEQTCSLCHTSIQPNHPPTKRSNRSSEKSPDRNAVCIYLN